MSVEDDGVHGAGEVEGERLGRLVLQVVDDFGRITGQGFDDEAGTFFAFVATPVWH